MRRPKMTKPKVDPEISIGKQILFCAQTSTLKRQGRIMAYDTFTETFFVKENLTGVIFNCPLDVDYDILEDPSDIFKDLLK